MATIYISSTMMWSRPMEDIFDMTYRAGLDGIELWAQQFFSKGWSTEEYRKLSALYPLKTCVHSQSWDLNLASMNEGIRRQSVQEVKRSVELADALGAWEVTVHPGRITLPGADVPYEDYLHESLREILEYAQRYHICISLEVMEQLPREFVTDMDRMRRVCRELFDDFSYTLDVAHCDSQAMIGDIMEQWGSRISKVHVSNRKGSRLHTLLENGDYPMDEILVRLSGYGLPMVMEGLDASPESEGAYRNFSFIQSTFYKKNGGKNNE